MSGTILRWWAISAATTAVAAVAACASYDPITYTDRVPYEWETWSADAGADADGGPDGGDAGTPSTASPPAASQPAAAPTTAERTVFPPDNFWNKDISKEPVDPVGYRYIESVGLDTSLRADFSAPEPWSKQIGYGIPYQYVSGAQKKVPVDLKYATESDPGPYPIPDNPLIERGPDKHILMIDKDNWVLYELYAARQEGGKWKADAGAIFDLKSNKARPAGWTSADAAGLAIFPGLVRAEEVLDKGAINHALRFTVRVSQRAYVYPASHFASDKRDPNLPPMGMWVRLKSNYSLDGFAPTVQVVLRALKKHGMILADNGSDFYISGAPDARWDGDELKQLRRVKGRDLEVIKTGELVTK